MSEGDPATGALWELGGPQDEVLSGGRSDLGDIPDDTPALFVHWALSKGPFQGLHHRLLPTVLRGGLLASSFKLQLREVEPLILNRTAGLAGPV